ncbi:MAG: mechanosensitive ion channel family protein [bacterium]|nr:mechanosensitive ion channel family protein [bacterium]
MKQIMRDLSSRMGQLQDTTPELLSLLLYSLVLVGLIFLTRFLILRLLVRRGSDSTHRKRWRINSLYIAAFLAALIIAPLWLTSLSGVLTILGIFGTGLVIVNKEVILNITGWFYIMIRRPFVMGNRVMMGNTIGDVLEVRLLDTTMIEVLPRDQGGQSTGRIVHIPNSLVFTHPVSNSSKEFSFNWNEIAVPLTPKSDWKKARGMLLKIAEDCLEEIKTDDQRIQTAEESHDIHYSYLTPSVYVEYKNGAIVLHLRHLTEPRNTRIITDLIWREILTRFARSKNILLHPGLV